MSLNKLFQRNDSDSSDRKSKRRRRRAHRSPACRSSSSPRFESLESRVLLTTLAVDIGDVSCGDAGDNLYCEIQEAVDMADEGDSIQVHEGTYEPISIDKNDLSIQAVDKGDVVIEVHPNIDDDIPGGCDYSLSIFTGQVSPCAPAPDPGVEVNADGVTIEGLTVTGARGYGILVTGDHNRLQDNVVENTSAVALDHDNDGVADAFGNGIALQDAHHNTLIKNTTRGNGGHLSFEVTSPFVFTLGQNTGNGIQLLGSHHNTLNGNMSHDNVRHGIQLTGSESNKLVNNVVSGHVNGVELFDSDYNTLNANQAVHNNNGFVLTGPTASSDHNTLRGNVAEDSRFRGFVSFGGDFNTYEGNVARDGRGETGNGAGGFVLLFDSDSNILRGNRAENNVGLSDGFVVAGGGEFNTLQGNTAVGNSGAGFVLFQSGESNTLQGNMARQNGTDGFLVHESNSNTFKANKAQRNGASGFHLTGGETGATSNVFQNNSATQNTNYGFLVDELFADDNEFENNHCELNGLGDSNIADIC